MKRIYSYKIKEGSFQTMREIFSFPEQVVPYIDGKVCRVIYNYTISYPNLKKSALLKHKDDILFVVEILNDNVDKGYMVLGSMLEHLDEVSIVE